jgi:gamma-glutamyltranspeptidase/glutathione hydrolase
MKPSTREIFNRENQGRPTVQIWGSKGMASSAVPEATNAAVDVLKAGGNAVDACIAMAAVLAVTTPHFAGLAGDAAWLIYSAKNGEFYHLDGYSTVPKELTAEFLQQHFDLNPERDAVAFREEPPNYRNSSVVISMVPGTPAALYEAWKRFGTQPFDSLMASAITYAENGFPINNYLAEWLEKGREKLGQFPSSKRIFFNGGESGKKVLGEGDTLIQKDLAITLRRYAADPENGLYRGITARMIVDYCRKAGSVLNLEDLANYKAVWRPSCCKGNYKGYEVIVTGPPTAGIHVLQALNILETFSPLSDLGYHSAECLHVLIQACKLALADRRGLVGDPDFMDMNVEALLDKGYAASRAKLIQPRRATAAAAGGGSTADQTTHYVVIDRSGNIVAGTQSIGMEFGSGEVVEGTGLCMNDRTWSMSLSEGPNKVRPGRRPNIGHAPTIVMSNGKPWMALGSPGGFGIVQYVLQTIINVIDFGFDIQSAIEAPRFRIQDLEFTVGLEKRIDPAVREVLAGWGHNLIVWPEWTNNVGGVEAFAVDHKTGNILGGYDPRRNSMAGGL